MVTGPAENPAASGCDGFTISTVVEEEAAPCCRGRSISSPAKPKLSTRLPSQLMTGVATPEYVLSTLPEPMVEEITNKSMPDTELPFAASIVELNTFT